jgi:hypothetical protein
MRLIFQSSPQHPLIAADEATRAASPIGCLSLATAGGFELVIVIFDTALLRERDAVVELCSALKKNPHSRHLPVLALLRTPHRILMESLEDAGVEFVRIYEAAALEEEASFMELIRYPDESERIERMFSRLCPYLNYHPVSRRREMMTCGAYRNRMVLGPAMLRPFCEVPDHVRCPYYNDPKPAKKRP